MESGHFCEIVAKIGRTADGEPESGQMIFGSGTVWNETEDIRGTLLSSRRLQKNI